MPAPTAAQIAAQIAANVADEAAGRIDWTEFTRRQRAAWDLVGNRRRVHDRVLDILCGRA